MTSLRKKIDSSQTCFRECFTSWAAGHLRPWPICTTQCVCPLCDPAVAGQSRILTTSTRAPPEVGRSDAFSSSCQSRVRLVCDLVLKQSFLLNDATGSCCGGLFSPQHPYFHWHVTSGGYSCWGRHRDGCVFEKSVLGW